MICESSEFTTCRRIPQCDGTVVRRGRGRRPQNITHPLRIGSVCWVAPISTSQMRTLESSEPDARRRPSGENATERIQSEWPRKAAKFPGQWWPVAWVDSEESAFGTHVFLIMLSFGQKRSVLYAWISFGFLLVEIMAS